MKNVIIIGAGKMEAEIIEALKITRKNQLKNRLNSIILVEPNERKTLKDIPIAEISPKLLEPITPIGYHPVSNRNKRRHEKRKRTI